MKMELSEHSIRLIAEDVVDVGYLKNMGFDENDPDTHMKVTAHKCFNPCTRVPSIEISIRFEDKRCGSCEGGGDPTWRKIVYAVEGGPVNIKLTPETTDF